MTYYAICATAKDKGAEIINGIPGCSYRPRGHTRGQGLDFEHVVSGQTLQIQLLKVAEDVTLPVASSGTGGLWTVWILAADDYGQPGGDSWVGRTKMHIVANTAAADVFGPFALAKMIRDYPAKADELLKRDILDEEGVPTGEKEWSFPLLSGGGLHDDAVLVDEDASGEPVFPE